MTYQEMLDKALNDPAFDPARKRLWDEPQNDDPRA